MSSPTLNISLRSKRNHYSTSDESDHSFSEGQFLQSHKMNVTVREKSLIQKIPQQWRKLLTPLLGNTSVKRDHLTSMLAMRFRRQAIHTAESWDMLLATMSRRVPVVNSDSTLCFQSLLWCFPDSFIHDFLKFLFRVHDVISADSLHRFLGTPLPETCSPSVVHPFQELSAILAKRCGGCLDDRTVGEEVERIGVPSDETSTRNGIRGNYDHTNRSEIKKVESKDFVGDIFAAEECEGKSLDAMEIMPGINSKIRADRSPVKITYPSTRSKHFDVSDKVAAPAKFSAKSLLHFNLFATVAEVKDENRNDAAKGKDLTPEVVKNSDSLVILDSSDEEDHGVLDEKMNTEQVCQKSGGEVSERGGEFGKEVCKKDGPFSHERKGHEGRNCEGQQNNVSQMKMSDANLQEEIRVIADEDGDEDHGGAGTEFLTHMQKLKEGLMSGDRDATSTGFDFLLSAPASQVSRGFALMEWSSAEEDAVCGLIQGVVGLSETLSHAVSAALVDSIVRPIYAGIEETPSRQLMSCLSDLAAAFPQQVASVVCDSLQGSLCNSAQADTVTALCKSWPSDTLLFFLRKLCKLDVQLDENLLVVVQCVFGKQPDLDSNLLESVLHLLETGSAPLARNAKYGRLVLNFVKNYKSQMNSSHVPSLQSIVGLHSSVIRKSLQSAVELLPS